MIAKKVIQKKIIAIGYMGPAKKYSPITQGATRRPYGALKNISIKNVRNVLVQQAFDETF